VSQCSVARWKEYLRARGRDFSLFTVASRLGMESTHPAVNWVLTLSAGASGTEHEAVLSHIYLVEALLLHFIVHVTIISVEKDYLESMIQMKLFLVCFTRKTRNSYI
jgi:hypothetical protein